MSSTNFFPNRFLLRKILVNLCWVGLYGVCIGVFAYSNLSETARELFTSKRLASEVIDAVSAAPDNNATSEPVFLPK